MTVDEAIDRSRLLGRPLVLDAFGYEFETRLADLAEAWEEDEGSDLARTRYAGPGWCIILEGDGDQRLSRAGLDGAAELDRLGAALASL